jgi:hypothetical protein
MAGFPAVPRPSEAGPSAAPDGRPAPRWRGCHFRRRMYGALIAAATMGVV